MARTRALAALLILSLAPRLAHTDDVKREQSRAAFRKGVELVQKGSFEEARDAFIRAYELFPHPSILLNLGLVRARTGEYLQAEQDLVRFLADDGGASPAEIQSARTALADVRTHIGTITVHVSPPTARATIDGQPLPLANGAADEHRVAVGEHTIELSADGHRTETIRVRVASSRPTAIETALAPITDAQPKKSETRSSFTRVIVGASLAGVGGVSVIVGIACGVRAIALANGYNDRSSDDYQKPSVKSDGMAFRTASDVAILSGLVVAGVGLGFLLWPSAKTQVTAGPTSIRLTTTF